MEKSISPIRSSVLCSPIRNNGRGVWGRGRGKKPQSTPITSGSPAQSGGKKLKKPPLNN